jgi:intracellular septation protein A
MGDRVADGGDGTRHGWYGSLPQESSLAKKAEQDMNRADKGTPGSAGGVAADSTSDRTILPGPRSRLRVFLPQLMDILIPLGVYFALRRAGAGNVLALTAGAFVPALRVLLSVVRERRIERLAAFVLAAFALSIALAFVTGNARFVLAKESIVTIVIGVYFLGSLFVGHPFLYYIMRKFVAGSEEEARAKWERAWGNSKEFRHTLRVLTLAWGVGFVAEALVRLVLVYELPVSTMVIVSPVLSVVLFVVLVIFSRLYGKRVGRAFRGESSARA